MNKSFTFCIVVLLCAGTIGFGQQFIYQDGRVLRDSTKQTVKLKGVNLGGWLLWEGWIWGGGLTKESKISQGIGTIAGQIELMSLRDHVYHNFITERDIEAIGQSKMNVVRVPFHHKIFDTTYFNNGGFTLLDSLVKWCKKKWSICGVGLTCRTGRSKLLIYL